MPGPRLARTFAPIAPAILALAALAATGCDLVPERGAGEKLWRKHCAECHGVGGAGNTPRYMGRIYADLLDDNWRSGGDSIAITESIRNGVFGQMPAFSHLSEEEIRLLVAYLRELRGEAVPGSAR